MAQKPLHLAGNIPAVVTPFDEGGAILYDAFAELIEWHLAHGVQAICVAGDNGESWAISPEERRLLARTAVETVGGRVPVIVGASAPTARQSIAYAEAAAAAGASALLVGPQPYVLKATDEELLVRLRRIHDAAALPIVLYNSPRRTGISLDVAAMQALIEAVPIVALKESSRDFFHLTQVIETLGSRISILVGPAPFIVPGLYLGAHGFVSSGPEFFGERASQLVDRQRDMGAAHVRTLHFQLTRLYEALMNLGTWPAALKAAHCLIGLPAGVPREPVLSLDADGMAKLAEIMRGIGILEPVRLPRQEAAAALE